MAKSWYRFQVLVEEWSTHFELESRCPEFFGYDGSMEDSLEARDPFHKVPFRPKTFRTYFQTQTLGKFINKNNCHQFHLIIMHNNLERGILESYIHTMSVLLKFRQKRFHEIDPRSFKAVTSVDETDKCRWDISTLVHVLRVYAGWPDWADFRPLCDCLLWPVFRKLQT
jgi:hypothetical protein